MVAYNAVYTDVDQKKLITLWFCLAKKDHHVLVISILMPAIVVYLEVSVP